MTWKISNVSFSKHCSYLLFPNSFQCSVYKFLQTACDVNLRRYLREILAIMTWWTLLLTLTPSYIKRNFLFIRPSWKPYRNLEGSVGLGLRRLNFHSTCKNFTLVRNVENKINMHSNGPWVKPIGHPQWLVLTQMQLHYSVFVVCKGKPLF